MDAYYALETEFKSIINLWREKRAEQVALLEKMRQENLEKKKAAFAELLEIIETLRVKCPWDKEQDHKSIRRDFLEETYEVIEAINKDDKELLREELGDVLLQVVFHCEISHFKGLQFTFPEKIFFKASSVLISSVSAFAEESILSSKSLFSFATNLSFDFKIIAALIFSN